MKHISDEVNTSINSRRLLQDEYIPTLEDTDESVVNQSPDKKQFLGFLKRKSSEE